jgi:hypothetical protein
VWPGENLTVRMAARVAVLECGFTNVLEPAELRKVATTSVLRLEEEVLLDRQRTSKTVTVPSRNRRQRVGAAGTCDVPWEATAHLWLSLDQSVEKLASSEANVVYKSCRGMRGCEDAACRKRT